MKVLRRLSRTFGLTLGGALFCGCGARDGTNPSHEGERIWPGLQTQWGALGSPCNRDDDCEPEDRCMPVTCQQQRCQLAPPVDCNDRDECTVDSCDPTTGTCLNEPLTPDHDADGHRAPLPGMIAGARGACGDDCDDSLALAHPNGEELCDGADNDCNGVADDGFEYTPNPELAIALTDGNKAGLGGLAHTGQHFVVSLSHNVEHDQNQLLGLDNAGNELFRNDLALVNSDTFAGPLLWTGGWIATAWEDRRDQDYEIYFNRFDELGNKLGPDVRVTNAPDFSLSPTLTFTGAEHILLWSDRRLGRGENHIFAKRLSLEGEALMTEDLDLTPDAAYAVSPSVALGRGGLGFVYAVQTDQFRVAFRGSSLDLGTLGAEVVISEAGGNGPSITALGDDYLIIWDEYKKSPGDALWGAIVDSGGTTIVPPTRLVEGAAYARTHSVLNLGDRLLLFFSQATTGPYQLYFRTLELDLTQRTDAQLVVETTTDALGPAAAFGQGALGVAYTQFVDGSQQVYFTALACVR